MTFTLSAKTQRLPDEKVEDRYLPARQSPRRRQPVRSASSTSDPAHAEGAASGADLTL